MPAIVNNLTAAEAKRLKLIHRIQQLHRRSITIQETARITERPLYGKKYLEGDLCKLCRTHGVLKGYKDFIIKVV